MLNGSRRFMVNSIFLLFSNGAIGGALTSSWLRTVVVLMVVGVLGVSYAYSKEIVSLQELLAAPGQFHLKTVVVRGIVTRPELHVDESRLFINYVFELREGASRLVVFGRHDRTQGDIQIVTGRMVEVTGIFWHERQAHGYRLRNNLEALTVTFYPPLTPDRT